MELNENARIDTDQITDRRGSGGGGGGLSGIPIPIGGGKGAWIGLAVFLLVSLVGGGLGLNAMGGDGTDTGAGSGQSLAQECSAEDRLQQLECRNALYVNSIQDYWKDALPQHFGEQYAESDTVFFQQAVSTGCGNADSGVGPFYCPADDLVYIDLTFYRQLADQLGAPGEFAQPYVLAHEYGHHVQDLLGTEAEMRRAQERDPGAANQLSVALELQADCYAGAWAKNATGTDDASGQKIFKSITDRDIQEGLDTAAAIGDDTLQQKSGNPVDEEAFTHGSSADRQKWFRTGYDTGDPKSCNTFGNAL
ncbi:MULTISPECIES: KPN_02809 family neutral zinc metallopeptidase [Catenuloplanes]|uniref:Metalloprotease n=1 Tax=Catenuloplanes niger TaxID=587534 RepID=A0AAE3ZK39_9ACTN|nr:neutral zinc metallopeptidase [Catenuloplanes niger]MDR7321378.1 putative metalloprotease [Catenuloplanes niger]